MERVLKPTRVRSLFLVIALLTVAHSALATTAIIPADDDMVIGARAILRGKVVAIESSFDLQTSRIYTYITVKVREVLKGQITERRVVLKELGGQAGDKTSVVYGNPQFKKGEKVLLYLDTWADGSLRTYQMFLGKFNIVTDPITGEETAVRSAPDENTTVLQSQLYGHGVPGRSTERQELSEYIRLVKNRLAANWERSVRFEAEAYANKPVLAEPAEYGSIAGKGDISPNFSFLGPFRFFEPDSGQPVSLRLNPNASSEQGVPQVTLSSADVAAAGGAWSNVSGCSLNVSYGGPLNECYLGGGTPGIHVVSNNCDGRNSPTTGCAGILAWGGVSLTGPLTRTINGTLFRQTTQGFVSMNPWAACSFTVNCNVQEILTHEIGHALGLGHSQFSDATMAAFAHFDGRCASIRTDDADGIRAIYPGSGGGPGPLTIVTTSLGGGTVAAPYSQSLTASGGTLPYTWSLVQGQGTLPPGLGLSTAGVITGTPTTAGTYNFTARVTDSVAGTAQKALGIVVSAAGGGGALNSQFVSQTVPTSVQPGQPFNVNMKFLNTGTQTWVGTAYFFASQNPTLNQTWGGNGVSLFGFAAGPGEVMDVTFTATAPTTDGIYNFQWQMYENGGIGFFGQMSTNVAIQVGTPPPPQNGSDTIGVYFPSNRTFYLKNGNVPGFADMTIQYGPAGASAVVGDWDGNGTATIGVYDPASRTFYLRNNNSPGFADLTIQYGPAAAIPVVGDWDGNGTTTIGVYDPGTQTFYLRNSNTAGPADIVMQYGPPGAIPITGDWNGDGTATVGVYDPTSQTFYLRNSNTPGVADTTVRYGPAGATPVVGDWDGNGTTTIGVYLASNQTLYLRNSNSVGFADLTIQYGPPGAVPAVGDWDGQ